MSIYLSLTREFNQAKLRAIISSGQAVVLHRLTMMSKDGDWILRENVEDIDHVLQVLESHGAQYRFGAPMDLRWLSHGWSSHLEFRDENTRIRTDFVTRPPRISEEGLSLLWKEQESRNPPFVDAMNLVELKKTNREKDYAIIGELARTLEDPKQQMLCSRSARDLAELAQKHPDLAEELAAQRPVLTVVKEGIDALEVALDAERRKLIHENENRLEKYFATAADWAKVWPDLQKEIDGVPLSKAHGILVKRAEAALPFAPGEKP